MGVLLHHSYRPAAAFNFSPTVSMRDLQHRLAQRTRFRTLLHLERCDSTQDVARTAEPTGSLLVWADRQSEGRGRQGRVWDTGQGLDLACTFRLDGIQLADPKYLAIATPVAVAAALAHLGVEGVRFDWPNDLVIGGRKLCGVLIDGDRSPPDSRYLIGIGLNVNRVRFPPELDCLATSLALASGREFDRGEVLLAVAEALEGAVQQLEKGLLKPLAQAFAEGLGLVGRPVRLVGAEGEAEGTLAALDLDHATLEDGRRFALATLARLAPRTGSP